MLVGVFIARVRFSGRDLTRKSGAQCRVLNALHSDTQYVRRPAWSSVTGDCDRATRQS